MGATGSLAVLGLGPARPDQMTLEARALLAETAASGGRLYALAHARGMVEAIEPGLEARSLDWLYAVPGVPRPKAYERLAHLLFERAFEDGERVVYAVAGSPLFYNDAVLVLRRLCADRGRPLRLVHGMSFVDLVLDRVYWTGHGGLQLYSAWNVARDGVALSPTAPALLCQLGEFTAAGEALDTRGSTAMLEELRDRLLQRYPAEHRVVVLYSSGPPEYRSLARATSLAELARQPVPVYSNLWVPALGGPDLEADVAPGAER